MRIMRMMRMMKMMRMMRMMKMMRVMRMKRAMMTMRMMVMIVWYVGPLPISPCHRKIITTFQLPLMRNVMFIMKLPKLTMSSWMRVFKCRRMKAMKASMGKRKDVDPCEATKYFYIYVRPHVNQTQLNHNFKVHSHWFEYQCSLHCWYFMSLWCILQLSTFFPSVRICGSYFMVPLLRSTAMICN